jgi:hypothetical protein
MDLNHSKKHSEGSKEKVLTLKNRAQNTVQPQCPSRNPLLPSLTIREKRKTTRFNTLIEPKGSRYAVPRFQSSGIKPLQKPLEKVLKNSIENVSDGSPETDFKDSSRTLHLKQAPYVSLSPRKEKKGPSRFLPRSEMKSDVKKPQLYNAIKAFGKDFEKIMEKRSEKLENCRYFESPDSISNNPREAFSLEEGFFDFDLKYSENYQIDNEKAFAEPRFNFY